MGNDFVQQARQRGILLSDYAEGLLRLAVESWYEDSPKFRTPPSREEMVRLADKILRTSFEDPHLNRPREVRFHDLLWSLAQAGKRVVGEAIDKGF